MDPNDCYLDLKTLSERTCISVGSLRGHIKNLRNPLPCFRIGDKIYVRWSEFVEWTERFRVKKHEDLKRMVDSVVKEVLQKKR